MKLTKNFSLSEFECNCGCEMPEQVKSNVIILAKQLQVLRDYLGEPIRLTNAYRCVSRNKKVGGSKNSRHLYGMAADIISENPSELASTIEKLINDGDMLQGGIGIYPNKYFVHYDTRKTKARW